MKIQATTKDAYKLLHEGTLAMAELEANGIRVDMKYTKDIQKKITKQIKHLTEQIKSDEIYKAWKKKYSIKTNLQSRAQLADVLFNVMKFPNEGIAVGKTRLSANAEALEDVKIPFVKRYVEIEKLKKANGTYIKNILIETGSDGIIHPNFSLHLVSTYRGQSDHPNFTNIPTRDELIKKLIRRCFIPRSGGRITDIDFKGSEVNAAAWYHQDPVMLRYIKTDPGRMHFDASMALYKLPAELMTPEIRYNGKNKFIFPQFYGDWWLSCAKSLWRAIDRQDLKTANGMPLKKWLKKQGITCLGSGDPKSVIPNSFEAHVRDYENYFWNKQFMVYKKWKDSWYADYLENGFVCFLTGFIVEGHLDRKQCINYPIQGTAFHCLLWCVIRIIKLLKKYNMKTLLVGQIHDDVVSDTPDKELKNYLEIAMHVITVELKEHWSFINTPMQVEVEVTPIDKSWYEKKEFKI